MIIIHPSKNADTRSCDFKNVTKEQLLDSSIQHITDVNKGLEFFQDEIEKAITFHDYDKVSGIDLFHKEFITGFATTEWWDNHRKVNRHHLLVDDGIPSDVNLIDVLEMIVDCVMAGKGRTGIVYPLGIKPEVLMQAFTNTVELLKNNVEVVE
jgi:hypothetical protein